MTLRIAGVLAALLAACALAATEARADGDPASDVLISAPVFYPYNVDLPPEKTEELQRLLADAKDKGYTMRVALIANEYDLGAVVALWEKPQDYAKFLAQELANFNTDWLLIVMPNGYGIYHCQGKKRPGGYEDPCEGGEQTTRDVQVLKSLPTPAQSGDDLVTAAIPAVRQLAALHGVDLGAGGPVGAVEIAAGVGLVAALGAGFVLYRRFRPAGGEASPRRP